VKIVLDTTILVRANEHSHGLARELLTNIIESEHRLLLSNEMLYELARVLRYPSIASVLRPHNEPCFRLHQFPPPIRDVNDVVVMQTAIIGEARHPVYKG
jgi:predicted nucleic acid-binding protein